ncbi:sugar translocase [Oscillospiraceae bacterium HV4-5-C5C]|nr:sugar translocase [Oscillospiraceae bacterium HV4-5-C5C]
MDNSRTTKSIRNTFVALVEQGIYTVMSFLCRTVFIYSLGKVYLGFSGLFSDILTLLSLAELGVGTAILYSMYKPTAEGDHKRVAALLNLYKKVYNSIGIIITVVGLVLTPFLKYLISDIPDMPEIPLIYILYLLNTTTSYFFIYKKSILITDQRNYIASLTYICTTTLQNTLQIIFLLATHNFIIYLLIQIACTLANNIIISVYVDRHYSYLKIYKNERLSKEDQHQIYNNVKAMFVSKLSSAVVTSTDNLLISKFVSTIVLGLYSNYTLFTTMLRTIISKIFEALTGSVGNLVALESSDKVYKTFKKIWFVNFWLVSFSCAALFALVNPFISLWIGESYLLEEKVVFIVCLNLYMRLIRNTFLSFNDTYGMFRQLKPKCIAEAIINLTVSLLFVTSLKMGIYGVLLGTFISNITTNFWYEPYLLFNKFGVSLKKYFLPFGEYILLTAISAGTMFWLCNSVITFGGWLGFIFKVVITCIGINLFYTAVFARTDEFKYFLGIIKARIIR